jgi:hypothetical protein
MADLKALQASNAMRWAETKTTRGPEFMVVAERLCAAKERYRRSRPKRTCCGS